MKIYLPVLSLAMLIPATAAAQTATDGFYIAQPDLKGTARFMSMGGAFGALGGDLSTLSQNPAGIGVYRSSEIGFTLDLDCQHSNTTSGNFKTSDSQTKFLLNNIGGVATFRLGSSVVPNFNFGFTYNKPVSFNRRYTGYISNLSNSMTNYIAGVANANRLTVGDVESTDGYDPYNPTDGGYPAPWISILGYDSFAISPEGDPDDPHWIGQWGQGTSGNGSFYSIEQGSVDEYNIALGGNISNVVYWGMDFGITSMDFRRQTYWGESLKNAYVDDHGTLASTNSDWNLYNSYRVNGTGFNYKLGVIVKPIQELRIGFAFHTPTWYSLTERFFASAGGKYSALGGTSYDATTNNGYDAYNDFNFRTPWRFIASAAGVIAGRFIVSADYEWASYQNMHFSQPTYNGGYDGGYDDWWWDGDYYAPSPRQTRAFGDPYAETNNDVKNYYQTQSTFRLGAEFRVTPQFSVRAGYSYVSSPVKNEVRENRETVYTGLNPSYSLNNTTNYITCGLGYRIQKFYVDLAYVYKHLSADWHAYTPDSSTPSVPSPQASVSLDNSQIVLSCGFRF